MGGGPEAEVFKLLGTEKRRDATPTFSRPMYRRFSPVRSFFHLHGFHREELMELKLPGHPDTAQGGDMCLPQAVQTGDMIVCEWEGLVACIAVLEARDPLHTPHNL